ncbi:aryl hydrocarbon receptor-like isoform X1 [Scleropages formosus]|uniref:aryl hydrocarbon receptor-like isoform X1 n=1 Tax=Scleropages formosus TaxID=113540 RepID=UPI0008784839|nr:aryl hydrocarbon receptor-like isoform X1 [Scleropages formosus]
MSATVGIYAAKKRKKPVQKIPKPPPPEGAKSNPSKRHRDRLNGELDKLTSLLPFAEDVRARLDKLSVLRLSVGYLKVKSFFNATMKKGSLGWLADRAVVFGGNGSTVCTIDGVGFSEGDLLLQALNGFVLVVTAEGYVFYASPTVQDYLGFHQSDVVHQSVFELIHTDDRAMFRSQLHFALNPTQFGSDQGGDSMESSNEISSNIVAYDPQHIPPENSSFLERSFCCRFRCLLDNSSGFLALNFQGRLKYLHGQNKLNDDGTMPHPQLALFAIAVPMQPPSILEIRTKTLIFQTKHKLDFTPMGIDPRGKIVLGYNEIELCTKGSGYQFIHAADMMYCADNHIRMIKTGESGLTIFRLLTKTAGWVWVQANARLVYKGGRPDFIIARQRALTNEEGEENLRQRKMQLPFNFATGEALLYDISPSLEMMDMTGNSKPPKMRRMPEQKALDPNSLLGSMLKQDQSVYVQYSDPDSQFSLEKAFMDSHAVFNAPSDAWQQGAPKQCGNVKEETIMKDMMETLEQILGDRNMCSTLQDMDVGMEELKDWENTLLRINMNSSDISVELNDILTNDIFNYVEEELLKDKGVSPCMAGSEQLIPVGNVNNYLCSQNTLIAPSNLPPMGLPAALLLDSQNLNPQNQVVPDPQTNSSGLSGQSQVEGMQKLSNLGRPISMGLNSSVQIQSALKQMQPENKFPQISEYSEVDTQKSLGQNSMGSFAPNQTGSCALEQSQMRSGLSSSQPLFRPVKLNSLGPQPQEQAQLSPQGLPSAMALALQGHPQSGKPAQQVPFRQQNSITQSNCVTSSQWAPRIPDADFANRLLETCPSSVLAQDDRIEPSPVACLQGHFSMQTQGGQIPRLQSWIQQQPNRVNQNGHQPLPSCYGKTPDLARMSAAGSQNCKPGFGTQNMPNGVYRPTEGPAADQPLLSTNSCMFKDSLSNPINGMRFGDTGLAASVPSCQKMKSSQDRSPQHGSYYFQMSASEPIVGTSVIPQEDISISPLSYPLTPGFSPDDLLAHEQYVSCNGQTQQIPSHTAEENGPFSFPPLPHGTPYFSETKQSNF